MPWSDEKLILANRVPKLFIFSFSTSPGIRSFQHLHQLRLRPNPLSLKIKQEFYAPKEPWEIRVPQRKDDSIKYE
ncbi:hypothetical protein CDAR_496451 [Caerostris darwini]|uniref:Ribosomal protein L33 n=1 Tax=Caerostris darwini TaxID=1538125 RepID=A0AAV4Q461_9ARAC|nr:hypothetical protein CDAR_496451 [Caerostris darwini]